MDGFIRELREWRDYLPAAIWGAIVLAAAVAAPICAKLLL
jgi:hypothetical protein